MPFLDDYRQFSLDSTLSELPSFRASVDSHILGREVELLFNQDKQLPGILIMDADKIIGLVSRKAFYEILGKRFGTEIYLNRPIYTALERISHPLLILPADCKISVAANEGLKRPVDSVYEPIIIKFPDYSYKLVEVLYLFMVQSELLLNQHNQALFDLMAGLKISDDVALEKFIQFASLPSNMDRSKLMAQYSIICMRCGQRVDYSIADIVRSHQNLKTGIEIKNRMGNRFYTFHPRHQCGKDLVEIPVQHDQEFNFCSLRLPKVIGSYV